MLSSLHAIEHAWREQVAHGGLLLICGLQPQARRMFERTGLVEAIGADQFLWSADQAIAHACLLLSTAPAPHTAPQGADDFSSVEHDMPLGIVTVE